MAAATKVKKEFKPPKNLAECSDMLGDIRVKRLAKQKEADELEKQEVALKQHLIKLLPVSKAGGIAGKRWRSEIQPKSRPQLDDMKKLQTWIKKTGDFGVLNQALNAKHLKELWEDKKVVPGVSQHKYKSISLTKVK